MKKLLRNFLFLLILLSFSSIAFATTLGHGPNRTVAQENNPDFVPMYKIWIKNSIDGEIKALRTGATSWETLGKVLRPVNQVSRRGYTASKWGKFGGIAATAVNAVHVLTDYNNKLDKGVIFSILPKEFFTPPKDYRSYFSPTSALFTNIPAGKTLFGGGFAPFVGNQLYTEQNGVPVKFKKGYIPKVDDVIIIKVERPKRYPQSMIFENRFGGFIWLEYPNGDKKKIGQVLRPVYGVGRFTGTQFASNGRIRANHPGVLDISCSPIGQIGGFQIIPADHGMSPEMGNARFLTQWMVISPINGNDPSLEGVAPFFSYFFQPSYNEDDIDHPDWIARFQKRFLVDVKKGEKKDWEPLPVKSFDPNLNKPLPGWANTFLNGVTEIRILFPVYK